MNQLIKVDETGTQFPIGGSVGNPEVLYNNILGRPRANGVAMSTSTNLIIKQMAQGNGITFNEVSNIITVGSESYQVKRIYQSKLINNSINPNYLRDVLPVGYAGLLSVLGTTTGVPVPGTNAFGYVVRGNTTGEIYYNLLDTSLGVSYVAIQNASDTGIIWKSQKTFYTIPAHPEQYDALLMDMFDYSDGTAVQVVSGTIQYNYDDWVEWGNIDSQTNLPTDTRIEWQPDGGLYIFFITGTQVKIAQRVPDTQIANTIPGTYPLTQGRIGTKINGTVGSRWGGKILVGGTPEKNVDIATLHLLVKEVQLVNNDSINLLYQITEEFEEKLDTIEEGAQVNEPLDWNEIINMPEGVVVDVNYNHTDNNYSTTEKVKLAGLQDPKDKGVYDSLAALQAAFPTANIGDNAQVLVSDNIHLFAWNGTDWEDQGQTGADSAEMIKEKYESNANTNAYTDAERNKLSGIQQGAQANVKPDWLGTAGAANEILNKPTIPTQTSQLTNNSGFVQDANYVHTDYNFSAALKTQYDTYATSKQGTLVSGTNIKTIGGNSILGSGNIELPHGANYVSITVPITVGTVICPGATSTNHISWGFAANITAGAYQAANDSQLMMTGQGLNTVVFTCLSGLSLTEGVPITVRIED